MVSLNLKKDNRNKGFTIVELLIVIVVIGILAALVITAYSGIQAKARNSKRTHDAGVIQTQLEGFFTTNGYYPSLADLNSKTWRAANVKGLDSAALVDPKSNCDPETVSTCVASAPASAVYSYAVTDASGASCETTDTNCALYTLTITYEGTVNNKTTVVKKNLS